MLRCRTKSTLPIARLILFLRQKERRALLNSPLESELLKSAEHKPVPACEDNLKQTLGALESSLVDLKTSQADLNESQSDLKMSQTDLTESQGELRTSQQESYHRLLELEVLYRTAPVGLAFLDEELRYVRLNDAFAEINGLSVEAHLGRHAGGINAKLAQTIAPMMAQVLASKKPLLNVEITGATPAESGRKRTWMVNFHPLTNAGTFGVSVVVQDVTVLKESEDICARFGLLVESSDDAIIGMKLDGTINSWNRAAGEMFGYSAEEVTGQAISLLATPHNGNQLADMLERLQRSGLVRQNERLETVQKRKDGSEVDVALTVSPIHDRHGRLVGASEIVRDITRQKRAHAALLRSNEELRQFAFAAAHDLQEPLRNIGLYAQLLKARPAQRMDTEPDEPLTIVIESAQRMQILVKDLLAYTEVVDLHNETGECVDCNEVCRTALGNLALAVKESAAVVSVARLPTVVAERAHLLQLFQNLIGNALKYRAKERNLQIHVSAERRDGQWVFAVKDNGIGIAPEYHDRIFGVFKRLHGQDVPGTGIGLAICKRIVGHHSGRLWLESEIGGGSTFYFTFPNRN
jgi:PAS domain S-box-containing protein